QNSVLSVKLASIANERNSQAARADRAELEKKNLDQELQLLKQNQGTPTSNKEELAKLGSQIKDQSIQIARLNAETAARGGSTCTTSAAVENHKQSKVRGGGEQNDSSLELKVVQAVDPSFDDRNPFLECNPLSGANAYRISLEMAGSTEEVPAPK